jgi:hypothetical protein
MNHYDVEIAKKEQQLEDAGYTIIENHGWFYWDDGIEASEDYASRAEAVNDAHDQLFH